MKDDSYKNTNSTGKKAATRDTKDDKIIPEAFQKEFQATCSNANRACVDYMRSAIDKRSMELSNAEFSDTEMPS